MSKMVWKINDCSHGGVTANYGYEHKGGVKAGYCPGVTMRGFIAYESHHFDSYKEAVKYIKKRSFTI